MHRTYLDMETAGKADIADPKKVMPPLKKMSGGAIRLFEPEYETIGIAEGIETAIACTERFVIPTWAAISTSMMESFEPPKGIRKVYIFGDHDRNFAGQKAAYDLAHKLVIQHKLDVYVYIPEDPGDFLDEHAKFSAQ